MKTLKYLFLAIMAMVGTMTFTACGDDDDDNTTTTTNKSEFKFSFTLTDDVLEVADVKVAYIGTDGVEKTETLTSTTWSKTFTADKFDVSAGVLVLLNYKDGQTLSKEKYTLSGSPSYYATSYVNGKLTSTIPYKEGQESVTKADQAVIETALNAIERVLNQAFKIDASGNVSKTTLNWSANLPF